jgi:hypothetical protein
MSATTILNLALSLLTNAVPALLQLYDTIKSGGTVTEAQVQAILSQYGIDSSKLATDIAAQKAAGN